jgi:hypothetical protein
MRIRVLPVLGWLVVTAGVLAGRKVPVIQLKPADLTPDILGFGTKPPFSASPISRIPAVSGVL